MRRSRRSSVPRSLLRDDKAGKIVIVCVRYRIHSVVHCDMKNREVPGRERRRCGLVPYRRERLIVPVADEIRCCREFETEDSQ